MATVKRRYFSRSLVVLGILLTMIWGLTLGWVTLPWLFASLIAVAGLVWP